MDENNTELIDDDVTDCLSQSTQTSIAVDNKRRSDDDMDVCDVFIYFGVIDKEGYLKVSELIDNKIQNERKSDKVMLILTTPGGDPDSGFRIGRALSHHYKHVTILIPDICKSAGTLITVSAHELIIGDLGELGPLDIQLRKSDEIGELSSTLDIFKAVAEIQSRTLDVFKNYLTDIKYGGGIGTKLAAEIASNLAKTVISPIAAQIDPIKLGEHRRALQIANQYAVRLNDYSDNLRPGMLSTLVEGYPCHSFVIDRREAKRIFKNVRGTATEAEETLYRISRMYLSRRLNEDRYLLSRGADVKDFSSILEYLKIDCGDEENQVVSDMKSIVKTEDNFDENEG